MRKVVLVVLGFVAGLLVFFGSRSLLEPQRAEAQPAGAKWEHKHFVLSPSANEAEVLKQVDAGGWEYAGYSFGPNNTWAVFKRLKK